MGFSKKSDRLPVLSYTLYVPATEAELGFEGTGGSVLFVNAGGFNLRVSVTDWDLGYLNDGNGYIRWQAQFRDRFSSGAALSEH